MWKRVTWLAWFCAGALMAAAASGDLVPKQGRGIAPPNARGDGPWVTRTMLATSTNGLDFQRLQFALSDQSGAPSVIIDHEQRARVYYVDFGNGNVLACATQKAAGNLTNWLYQRVNVAGLSKQYRRGPVDPCVVTLSNHSYRLFFVHAAPTPAIYSAISTNGIDFTKEEGVRFGGSEHAFNPLVLETRDTWLLWCGAGGRFFAHSQEGLNFTSTGEFRVEGARFMPWSAVRLPNDAGFRLYGNFLGAGEWSGGVSSVFSRDGRTWKREPGIRLSLGGSRYEMESRIFPDNGCGRLPDGTWLIAYLATIPEPRGR
jgi:hypothetical protein